ncbi:MAG: Methyltransferase type 11 [Cyanobacteria bacterium RYN_339]|nr:Methyltransferase type 11 [Cyanobacteria bacterium RYN_339]
MSAGPTRWGSDPEFHGPRHSARLSLIVRTLAPHLAAGARVLDVGAGAGRLANLLAARGCQVTGIEPSEEFVAYARAHALPGASFERGAAERLPYADGSFDAVVAGEVLEHLADDGVAVRELWRVLAPGGVALVTVPADPALWDASDDWAGHVRRYAPGQLEQLFTAAGFARVRVWRWGFPFLRLYHRRVYLPLLARKREASAPAGPARRLATAVLSGLFTLDRLFDGRGPGIGLLGLAFKPGEAVAPAP